MGSEQFERLGIGRSKEGALEYPDKYTVIGVDIDADALIARYKGSKGESYAGEIIRAVVQKYRTAKAPPGYFVNSLRGGVNEPIILTDLGPDKRGKSWAVVVDGRQRCVGLRTVNEENASAKPALPRFKCPAVFRAFSHKGAGLAAAMVKAVSNVHVAMTPSQKADDVLDLDWRGVGHEDIAHAIGARDTDEVASLLALAACCDAVKVAVDEGRYPLADVARCKLHTLPEAEQVARIARATAAPKGATDKAARKARDAAAPARAKTRPARVLASVEGELIRVTADAPDDAHPESPAARLRDAAAVIAWAKGGAPPPWLARFIESARAVEQ